MSDIWENAINLTLNTPLTGTWSGAVNDYQFAANTTFTGVGQAATTATGADVVYKFTAPSAGNYSFRVTAPTSAPNIVLYALNSIPTTTPGTPINISPANVLAGANRNNISPGAEEVYNLSLSANQTIYLVADIASSTSTSNFRVEVNQAVTETESNNTPATANPLVFGIEGSISPTGDVDYYSLGTPPAGSRVFAFIDGLAGSSGDFDLRVTTATDTLEYDDFDGDPLFGSNGFNPSIAGTPLTGVPSYLQVTYYVNSAVSEPYRLYTVVQPGIASATSETETNDTLNTANTAANNYFYGALSSTTDVDFYAFTARAGDLVFLSLDCDPLRNNTPFDGGLALLDSNNAVLVNVNGGGGSVTGSGAGNLTASTPNYVSEGLVYRITTDGTYYARVNAASTSIGDYLLSIAPISLIDTSANDIFANITGILPSAGPASYSINGGTVTNNTSSRTGTYGTLNLNTQTGAYTYIPNASAINGLTTYTYTTDNFTYSVNNGSTNTTQVFNIGIAGANDRPTIANIIPDQIGATGTAFNFTIPNNTFNDVDLGDSLTYSASLEDGSPLPVWLTFNATTGTFSGTPPTGGTLNIKATARDSANAAISDVFVLKINTPPTVATPIADQTTVTGSAFNFIIPNNSFNDVDVAETLTYSATLEDGSALPAWLTFNPTTRTFNGTPPTGGTLNIKVTATDSANVSVSDVFALQINNGIQGTPGLDILYGTSADDTINGLEGDDRLFGQAGSDTLNGGEGKDYIYGGLGNDTINGDAGNDYLYGNEGNDTLNGGEGTDYLFAGVGDDNLDGGIGNDFLYGNEGNDTLNGGEGNDNLDGGSGDDNLLGGEGNDIYTVDSAGDTITELANQGIDQINTTLSWILEEHIENLVLRGNASINGTGNSLNNQITGNSAANSLNGLDGDDWLLGKGGDDTLSGGEGNDRLDGGSGDDTLIGGNGNDLYEVDSFGDVIIEQVNAGIDTVISSIDIGVLTANVENLALIGNATFGAGNELDNRMIGNKLDNFLFGDAGNDYLSGEAGNDSLVGYFGNDTLVGGAGADEFYLFGTRTTGFDTIVDFKLGDDKIILDSDEFALTQAPGQLTAETFRLGSVATTASDRFIYNQTTGVLLFDADGNGSTAAVQIALFSNRVALSNANFEVSFD
jgi:VCBS repeat-containing protein